MGKVRDKSEYARLLDVDGLLTDRAREVIHAIIENGSERSAAVALKLNRNTVHEIANRAFVRASRLGDAPGHFTNGVAPGYLMGKVTVQRNGEGSVERTWERQSPQPFDMESFLVRCDGHIKELPNLPPVPRPALVSAPLTNFLGLFDLHIGEKISSDDPAGNWNIEIAKKTIVGCAFHAMRTAPAAKRLVLCFGGDVMHYDSVVPETPKNRHVLHSDGDYDDMCDAALEVAFACINEALRLYEEVHLIWASGNHDVSSSRLLRKLFKHVYANEERLNVVQSKQDYYALRFGKVMLGVHHGHGAKLFDYGGIFSSMFREMWGLSEYAYGHRGHEHHIHEKEKHGMVATQHPSLAPSDDYALSKGLISRRGCMITTYHDNYGEVSRYTARPEMLIEF